MTKAQVRQVSLLSSQDALNKLLTQDPGVDSQLNLITCGGSFNRVSKSYDQRVIVTSELLASN